MQRVGEMSGYVVVGGRAGVLGVEVLPAQVVDAQVVADAPVGQNLESLVYQPPALGPGHNLVMLQSPSVLPPLVGVGGEVIGYTGERPCGRITFVILDWPRTSICVATLLLCTCSHFKSNLQCTLSNSTEFATINSHTYIHTYE